METVIDVTSIEEGVDDKYILKAVFVAGSGGSGKSRIASDMFAGLGLKIVNQDTHLERLMADAGEPLKNVGKRYDLFNKARETRNKELNHYGERRLGLVIDSTGWDFGRVADPVRRLRALGYDCSMVFVSTSLKTAQDRNTARANSGGRDVPTSFVTTAWQGAAENMGKFRVLFGKENFKVLDNDVDIPDDVWKSDIAPRLRTMAIRMLSAPLKNRAGKAWLARQSDPATATVNKPKPPVIPAKRPPISAQFLKSYSLKESVQGTTYYHGSPVKIEKFDLSKVGNGHDNNGPGFYLTDSKTDAMSYCAGPSGFLHEIQLTSFKAIPDKGKPNRAKIVGLIKAAPNYKDTLMDWDENPAVALNAAVQSIMDAADTLKQAYESVWYEFYRNHADMYCRNMVKMLGYDGLYVDRAQFGGVEHVVVFNPDVIQIVAATRRSALT